MSRLYEMIQAEIEARVSSRSTEWYDMMARESQPDSKPRDDTMIEVGKVVLTEATTSSILRQPSGRHESIAVMMSEDGIYLAVNNGPATQIPRQKAVELGQMLLKAVEAQGEYAVAAKELANQKAKLDAKYKDLISGLGLEALVDRLDDQGGLRVVNK